MRFAPDLLSVAQFDTIPRDKFLGYFALREADLVLRGHNDFWSKFYLGWFGFLINDHVKLLSSGPFNNLVDFGAMFTWGGYFDTCFADLGDKAMEVARVFFDGIPTSKHFRTNGETVWNDSNQTILFRNVLYMTRSSNFNCSFSITLSVIFSLLYVGFSNHLHYSRFLCPRVACNTAAVSRHKTTNFGYTSKLST